jgi:nucleobase:cation symporter-1, NCS1 family
MMQTHFGDGFIEKRSIDYIPLAERHGKVWHLWPVWFSGEAHLATVATGVVGAAMGGNLFWMAIAVVLGAAFGTFFMAFHSTQGPQLGLPQMIQSRPQFGYIGALFVWGVALVAYIGFNAFNQILAAQTLHSLYGTPPAPTLIIVALFSVSLAIVGYDLIHVAQRWVAYVTIGFLLVFSVSVAFEAAIPAPQIDWRNFNAVPFLAQFFAAAALQISWSVYVSDYSRYLPRNVGLGPSFWWTYVGAFVGGSWTMLIGTVTAALYPKLEFVAALRSSADAAVPGFGTPILLCMLLGLVTITTINFYGASLTLLSVIDSLKHGRATLARRVFTLAISAVAATGLALASTEDFVTRFGAFLAVLLYLFTPWTAINLVDFYWVRRGHYSVREIFNPNGMYGRWNWRGLLAYGVGFATMIPFFNVPGLYVGPVARILGGADIAMLAGLPVATLVYLWACRSFDIQADRRCASLADAGLDETDAQRGEAR